MILKVGIVVHPYIGPSDLVKRIINFLTDRGVEVFLDCINAKERIKENRVKYTKVSDMEADLIITVGGDGTMLWTIQQAKKNPLFLGVNAGRIGFLCEASKENAIEVIEKIIGGEYDVDERTTIDINGKFNALNEVAVFSQKPTSLLEFDIRLDDIQLINIRADGIIVSTPTGSTGYSRSLGGSIIHRNVRALTITPANPFMMQHRPIIVPDTSIIKIKLTRKERNADLIYDGFVGGELKEGDTITVKQSIKKIKFARITNTIIKLPDG